jgi:uncharacterized protein DUF3455
MNTTDCRMPRTIRRILHTTTLGITLLAGLPEIAHAQGVTPPAVPPGLEVPVENHVFLLGRGVGTQNYVCQPTAQLGRVAWVLFTPEATLFDDFGTQLTTHFFSPNPVDGVVFPTWQDSRDSGRVWARGVASATVDPEAIPWVKLEVVATQAGPTGGDSFVGTTFVQRLNTQGGLPPTTGCDVLSDVGHKAFSPYTADYFFYRK